MCIRDRLYTVNTGSGRATAVYGGTSGGTGLSLNAMMIPSNADEVAYVNFVVTGEGTVTMNGEAVSGWQKVTPGDDLSSVSYTHLGQTMQTAVQEINTD